MSSNSAVRARGAFAMSVLLLLAALVLLAWLTHRHDQMLDLTYGQRRTLAPQTLRVLEQLDQPVTVLGFFADVPQERGLMMEMIDRYTQHTDMLTLEFVDLDRRPELARVHNVNRNQSVVLMSGDVAVRLVAPGEPELTGALVRLMDQRPPRVMFVTGHGEASIDDASPAGLSNVAELITRQNFAVSSGRIDARVPAEVDLLVLAAPRQDLSPVETDVLVDYLLRGGRLLAMLNPLSPAGLDSTLERFGILGDPGFVVDPSEARRNIAGDGMFRIALSLQGNPDHPITRGFNYPTLFPLARGLNSVQPPPPGVEIARLLSTDALAWGEHDFDFLAEGTPVFDDGVDTPGPLALAYAVSVGLRRFRYERDGADVGLTTTMLDLHEGIVDMRDSTTADTLRVGGEDMVAALPEQARLVVVGDVDFVNNANLLVRGNSDLMLAMVLWLAERENRIALAPRLLESDPIVLTKNQRTVIRAVGLGVAPALALLACALVFWRRSRWL